MQSHSNSSAMRKVLLAMFALSLFLGNITSSSSVFRCGSSVPLDDARCRLWEREEGHRRQS